MTPLRRLSAVIPPAGQYTPIGAFTRWITFMSPGSRNQDGSQAPPSAFATSWACIRALSGAELDKAQQIAQQCSHLVIVPYQLGIAENMLVNYLEGSDNRLFQIKFIEDPDERLFELRIYCFEVGQSAGGAGL